MNQAVDQTALQPVYQNLTALVDETAMLKIFNYYRGGQMVLPLHLYNREVAKERIVTRYNGHNQEELVRFYGYSERWTRRVIRQASEQSGH